MKTVKIFDNGKEVFSSDLDKVSAQTLENYKQGAEKEAPKPEREIRHGDFGISLITKEPIAFLRIPGIVNPKALYAGGGGQADVNGPNNDEPNKYGYIIFGNIFDLMAKPMKGEKEYKVGARLLSLDSAGDMWIGSTCLDSGLLDKYFPALLSLYIQHKRAEAQK